MSNGLISGANSFANKRSIATRLPTMNTQNYNSANIQTGTRSPVSMAAVGLQRGAPTVRQQSQPAGVGGPLFNSSGVYDPSGISGVHQPNTEKGAFQYYGQPNGTPGLPNTGTTVSAANRSGVSPEQYKTANQIYSENIAQNPLLNPDKTNLNAALGYTGLYGGDPNRTAGSVSYDYLKRNSGAPIDPIYQAVLQKKAGMTQDDFGIPANVLNAMKVKEAQTINNGYAAQRDAAKRAMARAGLLSDSAMIENEQNLNQQRLGEIFKAYTDLDSQNALKRNESYNKNLNEVLDAALGKSKFAEEQRGVNLQASNLIDNLLGKNKELESKYLDSRGQSVERLFDQYNLGMEKRTDLLNNIAQYLDTLDLSTRLGQWNELQKNAQQYATNQTNMTNQAINANR